MHVVVRRSSSHGVWSAMLSWVMVRGTRHGEECSWATLRPFRESWAALRPFCESWATLRPFRELPLRQGLRVLAATLWRHT